MVYFFQTFRQLRHHKLYMAYAVASGLSSLIVPLGTQFLVNKLSLAGIWTNTLSFLVIVGTIVGLSQIFRHTQIILMESLQREVFVRELRRWRHLRNPENSHYFFEIVTLMKAFAQTYGDFIEMGLICFFGFCTVIVFHPAFLVLPIVTLIELWLVRRNYRAALASSVEESDRKYDIYELLHSQRTRVTAAAFGYLRDRNRHFVFVRRDSFRVSLLYAVCTMYVLSVGAFLISVHELSVGQLVAAELIITGIMVTLVKFPKTLESLYDYETSHIKIERALRHA